VSGKKLFFLSLIILSVFMGRDWYKNRPKEKKVRKGKAVQLPVNLAGEPSPSTPDDPDAPDPETGNASDAVAVAGDNASDTQELTASAAAELAASATAAIATPTAEVASEPIQVAKYDDPVLMAFDDLGSSTFDPSPFTKMMADAGKVANESGEVKSTAKLTKLLTAPFGGLIETDEELQAIIGRKIYKIGMEYEGKTVKKVEWDMVTLEDAQAVYILPKKGVEISVASDGTHNILGDTFKKYQ
jgi:hypothetical protein